MDFFLRLKRFRLFQISFTSGQRFYQDSINTIEWVNGLFGFTMFQPAKKLLNARFLIGVSCLPTYAYFVAESVIYYRNDINKVLMALVTMGISVQMASKLYTFLWLRKKVIAINEMNAEYFRTEYTSDPVVQDSLKENVSLTSIIIKMTIIFPIISLTLMVIPLVYSLVTADRQLPYGFEVVHSDTWSMYMVTWWYQFACSGYVDLLTIGSESAFILFLLTACGQIDTIIALLEQLNNLTEQQQPNDDEAAKLVITAKLNRIIALHQHLMQYSGHVKSLFEAYFLIAIGSLAFVMTLSVTALVLLDWYLGIGMFFFASIQIFYMCFLGTFWQIKTELLIEKIGSCNWYRLSTTNQKAVRLFLEAAQSPQKLSAILIPLDVEAFLKIHKTVYSIFMLLMNFKE